MRICLVGEAGLFAQAVRRFIEALVGGTGDHLIAYR